MIVVMKGVNGVHTAAGVTRIEEVPDAPSHTLPHNKIEMYRGAEFLGIVKTNDSEVMILPEGDLYAE